MLQAIGHGQTARCKRPRLQLGLAAVCALMSMLLLAGLGAVFMLKLVGSGLVDCKVETEINLLTASHRMTFVPFC